LSERREATRISVNLPVRYSSGQLSLSGRVSCLSRKGMYVQAEVLDRAGADAYLSLALPGDSEPLELKGIVVRVDGEQAGMGIRFGELAGIDQRRLANFMIERSYQTRPCG